MAEALQIIHQQGKGAAEMLRKDVMGVGGVSQCLGGDFWLLHLISFPAQAELLLWGSGPAIESGNGLAGKGS